ncbi:HAD family hydrolase [Streptomyces xiamenensis]|uniref:HAD family hydrolase n=1 Tax=Streptomyces xiamenensis TaxID=408015 RepID=UPI0035DA0FBA
MSTYAPAITMPSHPDSPAGAFGAVLLDVDDTLLPHREPVARALAAVSRTAAALSRTPGGATAIAHTYRATCAALWSDYDRSLAHLGSLTAIRRHIWALTLKTLGHSPTARQLDALVAQFTELHLKQSRPDPALSALLGQLGRHYELGIVTNSDHATQHERLRRAQLLPHFRSVVCALDLRSQKPGPRPFLACARELGVAPRECLYIGDSWRADVVGAHAVGMRPVWIQPDPAAPSPPGPPSVARFASVTACLADLLAGSGRAGTNR